MGLVCIQNSSLLVYSKSQKVSASHCLPFQHSRGKNQPVGGFCPPACLGLSLTCRNILGGWLIKACSGKSGENAESVRGGQTMPYGIRELWLSMNTILFQIVSEWTLTLICIYTYSTYLAFCYREKGFPPLKHFFSLPLI